MSLHTSRTRLLTSVKELKLRWQAVRSQWNDPVRDAIEEEFVAPMEQRVRGCVSAMEQMGEMLVKARRECE